MQVNARQLLDLPPYMSKIMPDVKNFLLHCKNRL